MRGLNPKKSIITLAILTLVFIILLGVFIQFGTKIDYDDINSNDQPIVIMTAEEHNNDIPIDNDLSDDFFFI